MWCRLQLVWPDRVLPLPARANEAAGAGHADGGRRGGVDAIQEIQWSV